MATRVPDTARTMRKLPRQARSRDTLAVIVEAGAQVLARKGWSGFSTNEVAPVAGVSIGSIYQYFPNKTALIDAIRFKHFDEVLRAFDLPPREFRQMENRVAKLIDGMFAAHNVHPGLHRILLDEAPKPDTDSAEDQRFDDDYRARFKEFVTVTTGVTDPLKLDLTASVLASAVEGMVHEAARRDGALQDHFRDEVVRFVVSYLNDKKIDRVAPF